MKFLHMYILAKYINNTHNMFTEPVFINDGILYTHNLFNRPLDDKHLEMMKKVKDIVFGDGFNQVFDLTPNILTVRFSGNYYQQLVLTPNLTTLIFDFLYGSYLDKIVMPPCMEYFSLKNCRSERIVFLNKKLKILEMYNWISTTFIAPKYLQILSWEYYNGYSIMNLCIKYINLGFKFNKPLRLTKNVIVLTFGYNFNQKLCLNKKMLNVDFGCFFNHQVVLPKHLTKVCLSSHYVHSIVLTPNIKLLKIKYSQCENIIIDKSNVIMTLQISGEINCSNKYSVLEWLPHGVRIESMCKKKLILNNLPRNVQIIRKSTNYLNEPNKFVIVQNDIRNMQNLHPVFNV